jgi:AraC-like DNA-binding protein
MDLYIKNMVSMRCIERVQQALQETDIKYSSVELGIVHIMGSLSRLKKSILRDNLMQSGLELLEKKRDVLIEHIKILIIGAIHHDEEIPSMNISQYISDKLGYHYTYLSNLFSDVKGITIQQFIINHKIERVKELLVRETLNLTEIAYKLHYSSVAHLSNQFKKITGLSPTQYKSEKTKHRLCIENL